MNPQFVLEGPSVLVLQPFKIDKIIILYILQF
jgi:hypothetical protein